MIKIREVPVTVGCKCKVYADCLHGGLAILDKTYSSPFLARKWAVHMRYQYIHESHGINAWEGHDYWISYRWEYRMKTPFETKENYYILTHDSGYAVGEPVKPTLPGSESVGFTEL